MAISTVACAPYRRVSPQQRERIVRGRCELGGEPQGLVIAELGGIAKGVPLGGLVLEHIETRRKFAIPMGRTLAMLPAGRYQLEQWFGSDKEAGKMYRGTVKTGILTVAAGEANVWGRFRLLEAEDGVIALAFAAGTKTIGIEQKGSTLVVKWSAGDKEHLVVGACLGSQKGAVNTDTASIGGFTVMVGAGISLLSGEITDHGSLLRPSPAQSIGDLADLGGVFRVGLGWSFGSAGYALHEILLTFAWAGFGTTQAGKDATTGGLDPALGITSSTLIGLHGAFQYLVRPWTAWLVSPIIGIGTGVAAANVGSIEPEESDPDVAWSAQFTVGADFRVSEDFGVRLQYVLAAPLVGKGLPLTHQFVLSISILAGGDLWW